MVVFPKIREMGVHGIAVLGFFPCGIAVILISTCHIAVSSRSTVCGFSSFWLTVFGERRFFTALRYRLFALSFRYNHRGPTQSVCVADCYFIVKVLDLPFASPIAIYR